MAVFWEEADYADGFGVTGVCFDEFLWDVAFVGFGLEIFRWEDIASSFIIL